LNRLLDLEKSRKAARSTGSRKPNHPHRAYLPGLFVFPHREKNDRRSAMRAKAQLSIQTELKLAGIIGACVRRPARR